MQIGKKEKNKKEYYMKRNFKDKKKKTKKYLNMNRN